MILVRPLVDTCSLKLGLLQSIESLMKLIHLSPRKTNAIVDCGGILLDVSVRNIPIYGELVGSLHCK